MKSVRVGAARYTIGQLACVGCFKPATRHVLEAVGMVSIRCDNKPNRKLGIRGCNREWTALRLPPGTTGVQILELYGEEVASALHRALCPTADGCSADALAAWTLPIPTGVPTYLQRLPEIAEPSVGWHRAQRILATLFYAVG